MTDPKALREKLEQLIRQQPLDLDGHDSDCGLRDYSPLCSCGLAEYRIALDLLREKEEREKLCVWTTRRFGYDSSCGNSYGRLAVINGEGQFCPGCGHPVQVNQPQDAAEEE